jgi:hypothetical protein
MTIRDANNLARWIRTWRIRIDKKRAIRPRRRLETLQVWLFVAVVLFVETFVAAFVEAFGVRQGSQSA